MKLDAWMKQVLVFGPMKAEDKEVVERLWQSARFLPRTVRLLGTRYRTLFMAYAQDHRSEGKAPEVADAMAFIDFMFRQDRIALLPPEHEALHHDQRGLRRRFWLKRRDRKVEAVEKWRILQWLRL